jgi:hypothetical protein
MYEDLIKTSVVIFKLLRIECFAQQVFIRSWSCALSMKYTCMYMCLHMCTQNHGRPLFELDR